MGTKIEIPWLKPGESVGIGDLVQQFVDPTHRYANCQRCRDRQARMNQLLTFTGIQTPPPQPQRPHNVPIERPSTDKEV